MKRLAFLAIAAVTISSCSSTHPGVSNGSVTVCYRAIPVAKEALHEKQATLIGVHRVPVDQVRSQLPAGASAQLTADNDSVVCAVSFKGRFTPGQVDLAPPSSQGPYALILISSRHLRLVGSLVLDQLPREFGKRTL